MQPEILRGAAKLADKRESPICAGQLRAAADEIERLRTLLEMPRAGDKVRCLKEDEYPDRLTVGRAYHLLEVGIGHYTKRPFAKLLGDDGEEHTFFLDRFEPGEAERDAEEATNHPDSTPEDPAAP